MYRRSILMLLVIPGVVIIAIQWSCLSSGLFCTKLMRGNIFRKVTRLTLKGVKHTNKGARRAQIQSVVSKIKKTLSSKTQADLIRWPILPEYPKDNEICYYFYQMSKAKRMVIEDIFNAKDKTRKDDVTIVTQASLNRLDRVTRMRKSWGGPISVALHVHREEVPILGRELWGLVKSISHMHHLALHIVYDLGSTEIYPVNFLRSVALNASVTDKVFLLDLDLVCSPNLYNVLRKAELKDKDAIVVAAFEIRNDTHANFAIPNKTSLMKAWKLGIAVPFRSWVWPVGQEATVYGKWKSANKSYTIQYELQYEPYVLVKKTAALPTYNTSFLNRHWDRAAHIYSLFTSRYKFIVLPEEFVVHYPHPSTKRVFIKYMGCSHALWTQLTTEGKKKYPELHIDLVNRARQISTDNNEIG